MFIVRGAKILAGKILPSSGERTIFGLANDKASKRGAMGLPLQERLNVVLSIFIVTFSGP